MFAQDQVRASLWQDGNEGAAGGGILHMPSDVKECAHSPRREKSTGAGRSSSATASMPSTLSSPVSFFITASETVTVAAARTPDTAARSLSVLLPCRPDEVGALLLPLLRWGAAGDRGADTDASGPSNCLLDCTFRT